MPMSRSQGMLICRGWQRRVRTPSVLVPCQRGQGRLRRTVRAWAGQPGRPPVAG